MNIDIKGNTKSFTNISNTMLRFISKEGASQFPTVVLLANRMFLSDKMNIVKDKNLQFKLSQGCNFKWYGDLEYSKMCKNTRDCIKEIINDKLLCFKHYPNNPKDIINTFSMGNVNYFTTKTDLQYGTLDNRYKIKSDNLSTDEINYIYRYKDNLDIFITKHGLYFVDTVSKSTKLIYSDKIREFRDYSICSNGKIIIATNDKGLVLIPDKSDFDYNTTFKLQKEKLEYKEWEEEIPNPDYNPDTNVTTSIREGEASDSDSSSDIPPTITVIKNNGLPKNNDLTVCVSTTNTVTIGTSDSCGVFNIDDPKDKGYSSSGISFHKYISTFEVLKYGSGYKLGNFIYYTNYPPTGFVIDNSVIYVYDSYHVDCYKYQSDNYDPEKPDWKDNRLIFTLGNNNGVSSVKKFACDGLSDFYYLNSNNEIFTSIKEDDTEFPLLVIPMDYIYKRDQTKKSLKCQLKKPSIRKLIKIMISDKELDSLLSVFGTKALFSFMHYGNNFIYFGNDDRNKAAKEVKDIANAFDIG